MPTRCTAHWVPRSLPLAKQACHNLSCPTCPLLLMLKSAKLSGAELINQASMSSVRCTRDCSMFTYPSRPAPTTPETGTAQAAGHAPSLSSPTVTMTAANHKQNFPLQSVGCAVIGSTVSVPYAGTELTTFHLLMCAMHAEPLHAGCSPKPSKASEPARLGKAWKAEAASGSLSPRLLLQTLPPSVWSNLQESTGEMLQAMTSAEG